MAFWIAGVWNEPWKCIVAHDGVFDARMMGYSTEELWFDEWEHNGKTPYEDPAGYEKFNPVNHVKDWRVPILVVHGEQDFRIPIEQGIAAFTAAQRAASRASSCISRTRTTGCSSRTTACCGTTPSTPG